MIEAVPTGLFRSDFELHKHRRPVAKLDVSMWREKAEVEIEGERYTFRREGTFSGPFLLERGGEQLARAVKPSAFRREFEILVRGRTFTLRKMSPWRREFGLYVHEQRVGGVTPCAWYTRRSVLRLPDDWSAAMQAFVFWLALIIWRRDESSS